MDCILQLMRHGGVLMPHESLRLVVQVMRSIAFSCVLCLTAAARAESVPATSQPTKFQIDAKFVVSSTADYTGAIWIGTEDQGVWRISAGQATHFTTADGLGDDDAYALAVDLKGRVWVGHSSHGVSVFDGKSRWRNYDVTSGPWGSRVFAIAVCPIDGDVWIATEAGLTRYSAQADRWSNVDRTSGLPANEANALAFNAAGDLIVGLQCGGVAIVRRGNNYRMWQTTAGPDSMPTTPTGAGLPTPLINAILVARDGTICAGTTRGLALSHDDGKSWTYQRGNNWAQLVKGSYDGAPAGLHAVPSVLQEDWITCLAEGPAGVLRVGHRDRGYETLRMSNLGLLDAVEKKNVRTISAGERGELAVGLYSDGVLTTPLGEAPLPAPLALPSPVSAPDVAALEKMRDQVHAWGDASAVVENLTDDWQTKGDWPGRYGRRFTEITGSGHTDTAVASEGYSAAYTTGPYRPRAGMGAFTSGKGKTDINYPYCPYEGCREATEFNDGSWQREIFPQSQQGPDLFVALTLPAGNHRVSLLFFNVDGHSGINAERDYDLQIKSPDGVSALEPGSELVDDGPTTEHGFFCTGRDAIDAELAATIARTRVVHFVEPVYKRFVIRGGGRFWVKIGRNHSCVTKLQGVFVDDEGEQVDSSAAHIAELPPIELPKAPDADQTPGRIGAAARLWEALDAATGKAGYAAACWPMRLAAYRAALAAGADESLLASWRWRLGVWTPQDREQMDDIINVASSKHFKN